MAACDVTEFITNGAVYSNAALGGEKKQKAMLAYALMVINGISATDAARATSVASAVSLLGAANDDQIRSGFINTVFAASIRLGNSPSATLSGKIAEADYLALLDDHTLDRTIARLWCTLLAALIP